jgi:ABC-type sugar transport system ATPase subunit
MKALYRNADVVILDEPTAVLTPQEAAELFEILKTLTQEGTRSSHHSQAERSARDRGSHHGLVAR